MSERYDFDFVFYLIGVMDEMDYLRPLNIFHNMEEVPVHHGLVGHWEDFE